MPLAAARDTPKAGNHPIDEYVDIPVEAATTIWEGGQTAINAAGNAVPASADQTLRVVGAARATADNAGGGAGAISVRVLRGAFSWDNGGTTPLVAADRFTNAYAVDDETVTATDQSGTLPLAGRFLGFDDNNDAIIEAPSFEALEGLEALASGEYTPTLTDVTNVAASALLGARFIRVGNQITVAFSVTIDPTAAAATELGISLPVASAIAATAEVIGLANSGETVGEPAIVIGDIANDRASLQFTAVGTGVVTWQGTFQYIVQ
jgi:hypothetical protein